MKMSTSLFYYFMRHILIPISCIFLCVSFVILSTLSLTPYVNSFKVTSINNQSRTLSNGIQPSVITPTFSRFNHVEILDFIIYQHSNEIDQFSIYLSGRRLSWKWSSIDCFFEYSKTTVHGSIDQWRNQGGGQMGNCSSHFFNCPL